MKENLDSSFGVVFSQPVLLALVYSGLSRDDAYRIVQEDAAISWRDRKSFRDVLTADKRVTLSSMQLDQAFDIDRAVRHAQSAIDATRGLTR
jgi:adenylosuccinate lyase